MTSCLGLSVRSVQILVATALLAWRASFVLSAVPLKISPETTYVIGPLTSDGSIDYSAAFHERLSADVKPENNTAVLIDRAFGPSVIPVELRPLYFSRIGVEPLPEQGDYVITQSNFTQNKIKTSDFSGDLNRKIQDEFTRATTRAWTRADCPLAAEWLDVNAAPLKLIEQAALRPKYYSPSVSNGVLLEAESNIPNRREATRLLVARAMFRLGTNDIEKAWSDLLLCHRLGRVVGQRPPEHVAYFVPVALESFASSGDSALMAHGISAEQARKCLADHAQLPPIDSPKEVIDRCDRLMTMEATLQQCRSKDLDLNLILRRMNQSYDDLVAALKHDSFTERKEAIAIVEAELIKRSVAAKQPLSVIAGLTSRRTASINVGDSLLPQFMPPVWAANIVEAKLRVHGDLVRIGFALAACRADRGAWPSSLAKLVPKYLDEIPADRFTGQSLLYVPRADGFLVYSVGANGKDDAGKSSGSIINEDDVSLEVREQREVVR